MSQSNDSGLIQAAPVQRDAYGAWTHPSMPAFDEGDADKYHEWVAEQGLEVVHYLLEDDDDAGAAHTECGNTGRYTTWAPVPPKSNGWFMLAIDDTEDGPAVWWARRTNQETIGVEA
jgi:hypothetical protein